MAPLIVVKDLLKVYKSGTKSIHSLDHVSFDVEEGSFLSIVGASGCGKSTLLKIIAGLLPATSGDVSVEGRPVDAPLDKAGMVFQTPVLLKWRSVLRNILLPVELAKMNHERHLETARRLIRLVGLQEFEDMYPFELSGGMQQRVSLCRALVTDPRLLLMDEPFGALDAMTRDELDLELLRLWEEKKKTVLFVTHNIQEAVFLSDHVLVMSPRPGKALANLSINLPRPRTLEMMSSPQFGDYTLEIRSRLASASGVSQPAIGSTT